MLLLNAGSAAGGGVSPAHTLKPSFQHSGGKSTCPFDQYFPKHQPFGAPGAALPVCGPHRASSAAAPAGWEPQSPHDNGVSAATTEGGLQQFPNNNNYGPLRNPRRH